MPKVAADDLLLVSKSPKERLDYLALGAHLTNSTGYSVAQLRGKAAEDRLRLAQLFLKDAKALQARGNSLKRTVVSRAYYAMYHALRAATFIDFGGDDHEQHTILPQKVPNDFPGQTKWRNALKNARLERNRADYDPYPRRDEHFNQVATILIAEATELLALVRQYIRRKS